MGLINGMKYKLYGWFHKTAKKILKKDNDLPSNMKLVNIIGDEKGVAELRNLKFINEKQTNTSSVNISEVFPVENIVNSDVSGCEISYKRKRITPIYAESFDRAFELWPEFIEKAVIPEHYRYGGTYYTGYVFECREWCLPSWIWTNAALTRYFVNAGKIEEAVLLGNIVLRNQQDCGGWIVRNDFSNQGIIPVLAPNDSCYIASNCCLELYKVTGDEKYLASAEKTAHWVIDTAREDGLVLFGFDVKSEKWIANKNIVDTGFTGGLFASLYEITKKEEYYCFLKKFVKAYIKAFYNEEGKCFATAIDENDRQFGGAFGRGQAWALEGIIPAYRVLKEDDLKQIIESTIETLLNKQLSNGGWSYNLSKPLMGEDCKAVSVIAKSILEWFVFTGKKDIRLLESVKKAILWCSKHTVTNSNCAGGIFSYTIEGAIAHDRYSSTAFVYGSSYALECLNILSEMKDTNKF